MQVMPFGLQLTAYTFSLDGAAMLAVGSKDACAMPPVTKGLVKCGADAQFNSQWGMPRALLQTKHRQFG